MKVCTADIVVGDRIRRDVDDGINELCASIKELGQLQPIVVDSDWNLIAGARRLRACELLGINVDIIALNNFDDALKALKAERDENLCRKPFTPSELVEIGKKIEALEKPKAEERKSPGTNQHTKEVGEKFSPTSTAGKTRDKVAAALGVSGPTYEKAKAVVEAAQDESQPEEVRAVAVAAAKQMDETGKVDPAFKSVKAAQQRWEQGSNEIVEPVKDDPSDKDSDALWNLKRLWGKASKKDRKAFLKWAQEKEERA